MLGAYLCELGRFDEIEKVFPRAAFLEVFEDNPQIFDGLAIKSKSVSTTTDIVAVRTGCIWGIMNWDKIFCNKVGRTLPLDAFLGRTLHTLSRLRCHTHAHDAHPGLALAQVALLVRGYGIKLPARGKTPGYNRDLANILADKACSVRNKSVLYDKFVFSEKDVTDAGRALIHKGFKVEARSPPRASPGALPFPTARGRHLAALCHPLSPFASHKHPTLLRRFAAPPRSSVTSGLRRARPGSRRSRRSSSRNRRRRTPTTART